MKISIVIPVYNAEYQLERCLNSVFSQTYCDYEVIIINDGSTDDSDKVCKELIRNRKNVKYIVQNNLGVSSARNKGIEISSGEYICFIDADDYIRQDCLEKMVEQADKHLCDIMCCATMVCFSDGSQIENSFFRNLKHGECKIINKDRVLSQIMYNEYFKDAEQWIDIGVVWAKLYKREFIQKNKLCFDSDLKLNEDNCFNLLAVYHANEICYLEEPLYFYYLYNGTSRQDKNPLDEEKKYTKLIKIYCDFYYNCSFANNSDLRLSFYLRVLEYMNSLYNFSYFNVDNNRIVKELWKCYLGFHKDSLIEDIIKNIDYKMVEEYLYKTDRKRLWFLKRKQYLLLFIIEFFKVKTKRMVGKNITKK